jgi:hypothetical protein
MGSGTPHRAVRAVARGGIIPDVPQPALRPRLFRTDAAGGPAVYVDDAAGVRWRVHWVRYGPPLA